MDFSCDEGGYTSLAKEHDLTRFVGKFWPDRPERRLEKRERIMESLGIEPVYIGYQRQLMLTAKGVDILLANKSLFQDPRNAKARMSPPDFEGESFPSDFPKSKTAVDFR